MIFVALSPTRYAAVAISGDMPSSINMGTITGAISAHLKPLAEPINKFSGEIKIMAVSSAQAGRLVAAKKSAPCTAANSEA